MKLDFSKIRTMLEQLATKEKKARRPKERAVPAYLRKCKYCKHLELTYCRFHAVTIHPESRACPAFVLREEFAVQPKKEEGTVA
ncbi:hypothetical protein [Ignicoccus hospitalis]|uniref:Uncharacterized protein n=1 Tax=Ignicoccus hospitalis (strain KIN4/I / DSM 18386 / JCM 14125) TaxID=453591 RepID=A8AA43_IGNH4|nr:hypothetical protein [Ignicoccus hospitalis]ABU81795.1 hypothetical protein Igni_0613 [Ignicoccus hospitalis KIN4/I]HIH90063.1 hypothetical protein [Desulfurococcaceae archaeon]